MNCTAIWRGVILALLFQGTASSRTPSDSSYSTNRTSHSAIRADSTNNKSNALTSSNKRSPIYDVMDEIFKGYEPSARPVRSPTTATVINVTFNLMSINHVDEKEQTLTQTFFMDLMWYDEHLAWKSLEYGGLDHVVVPQEKVWLPDLAMTPFATTMSPLGYDELPLRVESSGKVWWQPSGVFTTHCEMDITYYPFDKQICRLRLEAWASRIEDVVLRIPEPADLAVVGKLYTRNSEWQLLSVEAQQDDIVEGYGGFSGVVLYFSLRRRPTFSLLVVATPNILLAFLSTFVFLLPAQCGEKVAFSITIFLTFSVSLSIMFSDLPHSSLHLSLHVTFLSALAVVSALAVLLSLLVLRLLQRHYSGAQPVGPGWAELVACVRLYRNGKYVTVSKRIFRLLKEAGLKKAEHMLFRRGGDGKEKKKKRRNTATASVLSFGSVVAASTSRAEENEMNIFAVSKSGCVIADPPSDSISVLINGKAGHPSREVQRWSSRRSRASSVRSGFQPQLTPRFLEVNDAAERQEERMEEEEEEEERRREENREEEEEEEDIGSVNWEEVARCLDYVFFRCFFGVVVVSTAVATAFIVVQYNEGHDGKELGQDNKYQLHKR